MKIQGQSLGGFMGLAALASALVACSSDTAGATADGGSSTSPNGTASTSSDATPPTTPSDLAIQDVTCTLATLSWAASTDNVGVAFYDIYHDGQLMTSVNGATLSSSITLVPGVTWGLYVNARDAAGNVSQASKSLQVTVPQCVDDKVAPTRPTNLTGSANGTS